MKKINQEVQALKAGVATLRSINEPSLASMSEVVMKKEELLEKLTENRAKHHIVLTTAIKGYWDIASEKLKEKHKKLEESVQEFKKEASKAIGDIQKKVKKKEDLPQYINITQFALDTRLGLVYPEDHSRDYDKAIAMMQSSVFDEVKLSSEEFDCYVLNNWEWKKNFLASNSTYITGYLGKHGKLADTDSKMYMASGYAAAETSLSRGLSNF